MQRVAARCISVLSGCAVCGSAFTVVSFASHEIHSLLCCVSFALACVFLYTVGVMAVTARLPGNVLNAGSSLTLGAQSSKVQQRWPGVLRVWVGVTAVCFISSCRHVVVEHRGIVECIRCGFLEQAWSDVVALRIPGSDRAHVQNMHASSSPTLHARGLAASGSFSVRCWRVPS